jgi:hypothetical protein
MKLKSSSILLLLASNLVIAGYAQNQSHTLVGAIRWEGWADDPKWGNNLKPEQWHYRLPFYAKVSEGEFQVRSDNQEVMDQEIKYASAAGLDYWAFDYSDAEIREKKKIGINLLLSSPYKDRINFSVVLLGADKAEWPGEIDHLISLFKQPTYQDVLDGRPLVYWFYLEKLPEAFGSEKAANEAIKHMRAEVVKAGLKTPYIVGMNPPNGAQTIDSLGLDAMSAYTMSADSRTTERKEYPYSQLAKINHDYWDACKAAGNEVVPIVNTGWDARPRWWDTELMKAYNGGERPYFTRATPTEIAENVRNAIEWNKRNPAAGKANAVIIYAWNETDEGGWLVPTLSEGTARLDAIKKVIFEERTGARTTDAAESANSIADSTHPD